MRIYLSSRDLAHKSAVLAAVGDVTDEVMHDDETDATYVDAADEYAGAQLLADVHTALSVARGESDGAQAC